MSERPPGLDDLLNHLVASMPPCTHPDGAYFDRTLCPEPCGTMHYRCKHCGDALDGGCELEGTDRDHHPMLVRWDNRHTMPAEVCDTCSDPKTGHWVPVPFCDKARAKLQADPDCTYTYGVIIREETP